MPAALSAYLDLLRCLAAFLVFLEHTSLERLAGQWLEPAGRYGHEAVVIFFVLSGFVIAYVADQRETSLKSYAVARASRIYSVCLPAIFLTPLIDWAGLSMDPGLYVARWYEGDSIGTMLVSTLFLNEIWFSSTRLFSNSPYWSLGFEVWYYIFFAVAFYLKGVTRNLLVVAVALIAGPKILLLLPAWILGTVAYKLIREDDGESKAMSLFYPLSLLATIGFVYLTDRNLLTFSERELTGGLYSQLAWANSFISDWILALLVASNIVAFSKIPRRHVAWLADIKPTIRTLAGFTFTLYVFHFPLLQFYGAMVQFDHALLRSLTIAGLALLTIIPIAMATEHQKAHLATAMEKAFQFLIRSRPELGTHPR